MKKLFFALVLGVVLASGAFAEGLGISSKVYATRFNGWAQEMKSPLRLRSEGAKVKKGPKATLVTLKVDERTTMVMGYDADPTKLAGVTLFRQLGGDDSQAVDAMTAILLTTMSSFENPKAAGVPDLTIKLCGQAIKKAGADFSEVVQGRSISCHVLNGALILSIT